MIVRREIEVDNLKILIYFNIENQYPLSFNSKFRKNFQPYKNSKELAFLIYGEIRSVYSNVTIDKIEVFETDKIVLIYKDDDYWNDYKKEIFK